MSLFEWPFLGPYMLNAIIWCLIIAIVGFFIGKISWHEPSDDEE